MLHSGKDFGRRWWLVKRRRKKKTFKKDVGSELGWFLRVKLRNQWFRTARYERSARLVTSRVQFPEASRPSKSDKFPKGRRTGAATPEMNLKESGD